MRKKEHIPATTPLAESLRRAGSSCQPVEPEDLARAVTVFNAFDSEVAATVDGCEVVRILAGHINTIFGLRHNGSGRTFIVQRMNSIFDLDVIDSNLQLLETAQRESAYMLPDYWQPVSYLNVRGTSRKIYYDAAGAGWRVMRYVPGDIHIFNTFSQVPAELKAAVATSQGEAIAIFGRMLDAIPEERWGAPLPDFHNAQYHLTYLDAVQRGETVRLNLSRDPGRLVTAQPAFLLRHAARIAALSEKIDRRRDIISCLDFLGHAVTHGDTKINNFIFRREQDGQWRCVCLIDLDTVQIGNRLDDLGDALRSAGTPAGEEPHSIDDVYIDTEIVENLINGYCSRVKVDYGEERARQVSAHAMSAYRLFLYTQCVRFFADALVGNAYYALKPGLPEDINLYRAEVQMRVLELLEQMA